MTVPAFHPHTTAVIAALEDADLIVGDAGKPDGGGWQGQPEASEFVAYTVVWPHPGSRLNGTMANAHEDADVVVQISSWGDSREAAETTADVARAALLAPGALTIDDRAVLLVTFDSTLGTVPDDGVQPRLWQTRERFRISSSPS